jgi:hypothetical protein
VSCFVERSIKTVQPAKVGFAIQCISQ